MVGSGWSVTEGQPMGDGTLHKPGGDGARQGGTVRGKVDPDPRGDGRQFLRITVPIPCLLFTGSIKDTELSP